MARILWSDEALQTLEAVGDYLIETAPQYAGALMLALVEATSTLETFPRLGRVVPEFESEDLRELIFESYRIVYTIDGDTVTVHAVLHSSMDVSARLRGWKEDA